jgi:hypothetical protein
MSVAERAVAGIPLAGKRGFMKEITETDDKARDKAIQFALMDVGGIAPESSRGYYE